MIMAIKKLAALSALLSVGFVGALDYLDPPAPAVAVKMVDRHPAMGSAEMPAAGISTLAYKTISTKKAGKLKAGDCAGETWPYISSECRLSANGGSVRHATRTITIEQRVGENTSLLLRLPAQVAQR